MPSQTGCGRRKSRCLSAKYERHGQGYLPSSFSQLATKADGQCKLLKSWYVDWTGIIKAWNPLDGKQIASHVGNLERHRCWGS